MRATRRIKLGATAGDEVVVCDQLIDAYARCGDALQGDQVDETVAATVDVDLTDSQDERLRLLDHVTRLYQPTG